MNGDVLRSGYLGDQTSIIKHIAFCMNPAVNYAKNQFDLRILLQIFF